MDFQAIPAEYQQAVIEYRDAYLARNAKGSWRTQLISDWLTDHRRQWGALRCVRNHYATEGLDAFLRSVPNK